MLRLCSASTTRAKILENFRINFIQSPSDFDEENIRHTAPKSFVYEATIGKFLASKKEYGLDTPLIAADTVVAAKNRILRKAKDRDDAKKILELQSGNQIDIITCTIYASKNIELLDLSATTYLFNKFQNGDIEKYLDTNIWKDKAGACTVELFCKKYIKKQIGYTSCAMGLSIEKILPFIKGVNNE